VLIAAQALGYGAQWITGWPAYHPDVRVALGHSPDTDIVGFVHIGTRAEPPVERPRPDAAKIVSEWEPG
jgi:nitroreductase